MLLRFHRLPVWSSIFFDKKLHITFPELRSALLHPRTYCKLLHANTGFHCGHHHIGVQSVAVRFTDWTLDMAGEACQQGCGADGRPQFWISWSSLFYLET